MRLALLALGFLSACAPQLADTLEPRFSSDAARCWPFSRAADAGLGCVADTGPQTCGPGTMPLLGQSACEKVGTTHCASGFAPDPSGWGCAEVAADGCTGFERPRLGSPACVPIDDCNQPWPPPGATHFVSPTGPVDATHSRSITAALVAQSAAGGVIAIDTGTYAEALQPTLGVALLGRCAAQVIVQSPGGTFAGIKVQGLAVRLEGLTLRGGYTGVAASGGADVTLRHVLIDGARERGVVVVGAGTQLTLEGAVVRGTTSANALSGYGIELQPGTTATVRDSVLTRNQTFGLFADTSSTVRVSDSIVFQNLADSAGQHGVGLASNGADLTLERSLVRGNREAGVLFSRATGTVVDSVVRDTVGAPNAGGTFGAGLLVQGASQVEVSNSTFTRNDAAGLVATDASTTVTVRDAVVRDTQLGSPDSTGAAARFSARLTLERTALVGNHNFGFAAVEHASLVATKSLMRDTVPETTRPHAAEVLDSCVTLTDVALLNSRAAALLLQPDPACPAHLERVWVDGVQVTSTTNRATGIAMQRGTTELVDSAITDVQASSVFVYGVGTVAKLERVSLSGSKAPDGAFGELVLALHGARVEVESSDLRHADGVALLFDDATGTVFDSVVTHNRIGIATQNGSTLEAVSTRPAEVPEKHVVVGASTVFDDNQTRVGAGNYPVPDPF
ncbi:MAG: right-handed parallel beta-helix repeat-containing protein [Archangiaceae bacterium]|nr:right-handed parallel beta-helix repeat-containing protein [Archangiaceae bacterium]